MLQHAVITSARVVRVIRSSGKKIRAPYLCISGAHARAGAVAIPPSLAQNWGKKVRKKVRGMREGWYSSPFARLRIIQSLPCTSSKQVIFARKRRCARAIDIVYVIVSLNLEPRLCKRYRRRSKDPERSVARAKPV